MINITNHRRESSLPGLWHDYANLFPMLEAAGQDALRDDVQQHGVRQPVILFEGRILDGRNRYMAARDLGLDFPVADFTGSASEALAYVLSTNLHRRHLTESQRAAAAAKLVNMRQGERTDLEPSANLPKVSQARAAEMLSVSERSVTTAKAVIEKGAPELVAAVERGDVSVSAAAAVATLPQEEQTATVAEGPKAVKAKAKAVQSAKGDGRGERTLAPAEPTDPERKALSKLTREALEDEVIGLRADLADTKRERDELRAEGDDLRARLAELECSDLGRSLGNAQRAARAAEGRMKEYQATAVRLDRRVKLMEAEKADLQRQIESQLIPLNA